MINSADEFARWYWLKDELIKFCRCRSLSTSGSKQEISDRIVTLLNGRTPVPPARVRRSNSMPTSFEPTTVIGTEWICSQALRAFFVEQIGPGFRFSESLRTFISTRSGSTLADALEHYRRHLETPRSIAEQFEYNRHTREFFQAHPGASREEAIASWWAHRCQPRRQT